MRYNFMQDERFKVAFEKADEVLSYLELDDNWFIDTQQLVDVVSKLTNTQIDVKNVDFCTLINDCDYGAMMCVTEKASTNERTALILLNSNKKINARFMRFSLAHELGHLITKQCDVSHEENQFTLSTHIDYRVSSILEKNYDDNEYLLKEQIANIFALNVLIPTPLLVKLTTFYKITDNEELANKFGVDESAIDSKLKIEFS